MGSSSSRSSERPPRPSKARVTTRQKRNVADLPHSGDLTLRGDPRLRHSKNERPVWAPIPGPLLGSSEPQNDSFRWKPVALQGKFLPRFDHSAVAFGDDRVIVFGGGGEQGDFGDVLTIDLTTGKVETVFDAAFSSAVSPRPRKGHVAAVQNSVMLIWGGETSRGEVLTGLWSFDLQKKEWKLEDANGSPPARSGMASAGAGTGMFCFGGRDSEGEFSSELWLGELSSVNNSVSWVKQRSSHSPKPRSFASLTRHSRNETLILVGGIDQDNQPLNDVWLFDPKRGWTLLSAEMDFAPRSGHSCVPTEHGFLLFGGEGRDLKTNKICFFADVWYLQVENSRIFAVELASSDTKSGPDQRVGAAAASTCDGALVILGGAQLSKHQENNDVYNDMWILESASLSQLATTHQSAVDDGVKTQPAKEDVSGTQPAKEDVSGTQPAKEDESAVQKRDLERLGKDDLPFDSVWSDSDDL